MTGSGNALKQVNLLEAERKVVVSKGLKREEGARVGPLGLNKNQFGVLLHRMVIPDKYYKSSHLTIATAWNLQFYHKEILSGSRYVCLSYVKCCTMFTGMKRNYIQPHKNANLCVSVKKDLKSSKKVRGSV